MNVLNFIKDYYYLIILVLSLVILIIEIILTFKKAKPSNVLSFIDKLLPDLVIMAEEEVGSGNGDQKLFLVLSHVYNALKTTFNITDYSYYTKYIKQGVERILSTPQKKGE